MEPLKIQLWMRGHDSAGSVQAYRTITGEEFAEICRFITEHDGERPWEPSPTSEGIPDDG